MQILPRKLSRGVGSKGRERAEKAKEERLWKVCIKEHKKGIGGVGRRVKAAIGRRSRCVDEEPAKKRSPPQGLKPSENGFCGKYISAGQIRIWASQWARNTKIDFAID